jgi:hydrogenase nickel insertion protein HypA
LHEATIAEAILDAVGERMASCVGASQARSVAVRCGEFRNVDPGSLRFAFETLRKGSETTRSCDLLLDLVPAIALCQRGHEFAPKASQFFACTACGEGIDSLLQGEELEVYQVVLEYDDQESG